MSVARTTKPDLILMDLGTAGHRRVGRHGARSRWTSETRHIPIIVLSAHAMPNDRHQALAAGGDDFDTKPVQFDRLLAKIETLLAAHGAIAPAVRWTSGCSVRLQADVRLKPDATSAFLSASGT